ncbi:MULTISPECIES: hypothetical protein [unclassified Methanoculleus]|jgi:hypothetical protein|uniref:hypothetical protein n=1 Tax=unclassified Methanoculleus TaxID=2619537 RepID=UPI0025DAAD0C|nr:hypothetical protein [Methanoculleus sp. UBA377]
MAGNRWTWRGLLVVLFVTAAALMFPVTAQSTASAEPLTWTLPPTPEETPDDATPEATPDETLSNETPDDETINETVVDETLDDVTPDETPSNETPADGTTNETANETPGNETLNETAVETGPPIIIGTDEVTTEATPAETSTAEMPTFTPIQAAQVNVSPTATAPLSLVGVVTAVAVAGLLVVMRRNRK